MNEKCESKYQKETKNMDMLQFAGVKQNIKNDDKKLVFPNIFIDGNTQTVVVNGISVHLTLNEFKILYLLASSPDKELSAKEIYHAVWKLPDIQRVATVQVHVARLRHKLRIACPEHGFIATKWKKGYRFIPYNATEK